MTLTLPAAVGVCDPSAILHKQLQRKHVSGKLPELSRDLKFRLV